MKIKAKYREFPCGHQIHVSKCNLFIEHYIVHVMLPLAADAYTDEVKWL